MAKDEIVLDGRDLLHSIRIGVRLPHLFGLRMWIATKLFDLAGLVSGTDVSVEVGDDFDPSDATTWERYTETTEDGGEIVLVRYPEGYRLRYHGWTVWKQ